MSSIGSAVSQTSNVTQHDFQQRRADFRALSSALQSGDLAGAQKAFSALQQDSPAITGALQSQPGQSQGSSPTNPVATDLQALQSALQSGDLSAAQKAFTNLTQDMQSVRPGHHHHHHHGSAAAVAASSSNLTGSATASDGSAVGGIVNVQA